MFSKAFDFRIYIFLLFLCLSAQCIGQDSVRYSFEVHAHKGFIIPHRDTLREAARKAYPSSIELGFSWLNTSREGFEKTNFYAENGLLLGYAHFGKKEILGEGFYFMMFTEPQFTLNEKLNFSMRASAGLIHLTKVYDRIDNPENQFYSSPVSGLLRLAFCTRYALTPSWKIKGNIQFNHISNGGMRVPNLGMNFPTLSLGFDYTLNPTQLTPRAKVRFFEKALRYHIQLFTASRLAYEWDVNSSRSQMIGASLAVSRAFNHLSSWIVGTELSHDPSLTERGKAFNRLDDSPWVASLTGGHLLTIGRASFSQVLGIYVFQDYGNDRAVFQRYSLLYALSKNLSSGFSMKAHGATAELIDLRLNINFGGTSKR